MRFLPFSTEKLKERGNLFLFSFSEHFLPCNFDQLLVFLYLTS
jgi:hypothetical protein